jgi:hypothetical protein
MIAAMLLVTASAFAVVPQQINYQGYLTRTNGTALDTVVAMTFKLYADSTAGTPLFIETRPSVAIANGVFTVRLGQFAVLTDAILNRPQVWLGITVGGDAEMVPRTRVVASAYAVRSGWVDSVSVTNMQQMLQLFNSLPDADQDGHLKIAFGGDDCDDWNPTVHPGASEICDGLDNNCDGRIDEGFNLHWYLDADGDGYGDASHGIITCTPPAGYVADSTDCNDHDAAIHPGTTERCNQIDDNCDGQIDEGQNNQGCTVYYRDSDGDGYGVSSDSRCLCHAIAPYTATQGGDCNDNDAHQHPGAVEICNNVDDDCDGVIDNGCH